MPSTRACQWSTSAPRRTTRPATSPAPPTWPTTRCGRASLASRGLLAGWLAGRPAGWLTGPRAGRRRQSPTAADRCCTAAAHHGLEPQADGAQDRWVARPSVPTRPRSRPPAARHHRCSPLLPPAASSSRRAGYALFGVANGTEINPAFDKELDRAVAAARAGAKDAPLVLYCSQGGSLVRRRPALAPALALLAASPRRCRQSPAPGCTPAASPQLAHAVMHRHHHRHRRRRRRRPAAGAHGEQQAGPAGALPHRRLPAAAARLHQHPGAARRLPGVGGAGQVRRAGWAGAGWVVQSSAVLAAGREGAPGRCRARRHELACASRERAPDVGAAAARRLMRRPTPRQLSGLNFFPWAPAGTLRWWSMWSSPTTERLRR